MTGKIIEKDVNDLKEEYFENGVVVIKNAIKSYWIGVLQEAIEQQLKKKKRYFIINIYYKIKNYYFKKKIKKFLSTYKRYLFYQIEF